MAELTALERAALVGRARAGGIASGKARRAKADLRADLKARMKFVDAAEEIAQEMLDAALGRGKWAQGSGALLDPRERAGLLKTCLEYAVGRPRPQDPLARDGGDEDDDEPKTGFRFGVAEVPDGEPEGPVEPGEAGDGSGDVPGAGP